MIKVYQKKPNKWLVDYVGTGQTRTISLNGGTWFVIGSPMGAQHCSSYKEAKQFCKDEAKPLVKRAKLKVFENEQIKRRRSFFNSRPRKRRA